MGEVCGSIITFDLSSPLARMTVDLCHIMAYNSEQDRMMPIVGGKPPEEIAHLHEMWGVGGDLAVLGTLGLISERNLEELGINF